MYDKILEQIEEWLKLDIDRPENISKIIMELDLIIKIKTIQMMDKSAGMLDESKEMMGNL